MLCNYKLNVNNIEETNHFTTKIQQYNRGEALDRGVEEAEYGVDAAGLEGSHTYGAGGTPG